MTKTPDPIADFTQKATETAMKLTQLSMEQGEQMLKLQMNAMRGMLNDSVSAAHALLEARDPQQWSALQESNMRDMTQRLTEYSQSIQELAGKNQKVIGEVMETRLNAMNEQCQTLVDAMAAAAPPGSAPAFNAMKQSLTAANLLVDTMSKAAEQVAKSAESTIKGAADTTKGGKGGKRAT